MNQFFIDTASVSGNRISLTGGKLNHIKNVLRLRTGEKVSLVTEDTGITYTCSIEEYRDDTVICLIEDMQSESRELPVRVVLYQGLPKSDKFEFVIQKAVEMGAVRIVPVQMKRSVVKLTKEKAEKKRSRWQAIADYAASQSKRSIKPEVGEVITFDEAIKIAGAEGEVIIPYELAEGMEETRHILNELKGKKTETVSVFIGPEGGFDETEVNLAREAGAHTITLGRRILRTETAPIAILAWLTYIFEE
ncbi:MAG: 16S rRNA (uracil(1498)-N(3))-methyltransferase [Lachnospiraceae bacterium]|nr:16S rRNA (uracil(1498)-N(3))-methyltransferase [Lachnospiraceae bacterium]